MHHSYNNEDEFEIQKYVKNILVFIEKKKKIHE